MTEQQPKNSGIQMVTPVGCFMFLSVWQKKAPMQGSGGQPKFEATLVFTKNTDLTLLRTNLMKETVRMFGPKQKHPEGLKWPLKLCDKKPHYKDFPGGYYIKMTSSNNVGILFPDKTPMLEADKDSFYSGCFGRAEINIKAYNKNGGVGVGIYMNNLWKTRDGTPLTGRKSAVDAFAEFEPEEQGGNAADYDDYSEPGSDSDSESASW